ncbi:MAG: selenide, water dikinase SelD [Clostridia bacterium]|nr:selenide, water dikinase SelD [Clostridia bacterium]
MASDIKLTKLAQCAGCGAKVGAGTLSSILGDLRTVNDPRLIVGFDKSDDASAYRVRDDLAVVQTLDFFPPIHDDPYTFGQIAAANAMSDIYAMGGEPKLCQNILLMPKDMDMDAVHDLLRGGNDKACEAGALITGGHSIYDDTLKYGMCVTAFMPPERILKNHGARTNDVLILTKPIGVGILATGARGGLLSSGGARLMTELMLTLNKAARDIMVKYRVHACTDVTGFSLLGHLCEMLEGSGAAATIAVDDIDLIPEALELARMGVLPEGVYRNRRFAQSRVDFGTIDLARADMLFDPQTSGGLLMAVDPDDAAALLCELKSAVPSAQRIGTVREPGDGALIALV